MFEISIIFFCYKKLKNLKNHTITKLFGKRRSHFRNINKLSQYNITNYNHNFFINLRSQFKQLIKEKVIKICI